MKNSIFLLAIITQFLIITAFTASSQDNTEIVCVEDFCDGWEDGYCEGWKDVKGQLALCPVAPICPVPDIGQNTYRGGYNKGFKAGRKAAYR